MGTELAELFVTISAKSKDFERVAARTQRDLRAIEQQAQIFGDTDAFNKAAEKAKATQKAISFMARKSPDELAKVSTEMRQLVAETRRLEMQSKNAARGQQILSSAVGRTRVALTAGAVAAGAGAAAAGRTGVQAYAAREQRDIAFTGLFGGDYGAGQAAQQKLQEMARTSPYEFDPLAGMTQRFMGANVEWKEIPTILTSIGDAAARTGKGAEAVERISGALIQMLQKGKVSSEEMTQQLGELIPAWQILADEMKTTVPTVQKMVEDGLIPADRAFRALIVGMEKWAPGAMADQVNTLNTKWSGFMDTLAGERGVLADVGEQLIETFDVKDHIDDATAALIDLQDRINAGADWDDIIPEWLINGAAAAALGTVAYNVYNVSTAIAAMRVSAGGAGILAGIGGAAPFLPWIVGATAAVVAIDAVADAIRDTDSAAQNAITGKNGVSPWSVGPIAEVNGKKAAPSTGMGGLRQLEQVPKGMGDLRQREYDFSQAERAAKAAAAAVEKSWRDAQRNIAAGSQNTSSKLAVDSLRATVVITNAIPARWKALADTYKDVSKVVTDNPMNPIDPPTLDKAGQAWAARMQGMADAYNGLKEQAEQPITVIADTAEATENIRVFTSTLEEQERRHGEVTLDTAGAIGTLQALEQEIEEYGLLKDHFRDVSDAASYWTNQMRQDATSNFDDMLSTMEQRGDEHSDWAYGHSFWPDLYAAENKYMLLMRDSATGASWKMFSDMVNGSKIWKDELDSLAAKSMAWVDATAALRGPLSDFARGGVEAFAQVASGAETALRSMQSEFVKLVQDIDAGKREWSDLDAVIADVTRQMLNQAEAAILAGKAMAIGKAIAGGPLGWLTIPAILAQGAAAVLAIEAAKSLLPDPVKLAAGGIVPATPGGTFALIGEAGRDEAVIPLGNSRRSGFGGGWSGDLIVNYPRFNDERDVDRLCNVMVTKLRRAGAI